MKVKKQSLIIFENEFFIVDTAVDAERDDL